MDDSARQSFDKHESSSGSPHPASYEYPYHESSAYHAYLYSNPDSPRRTTFANKHSQHDSMSSNGTSSTAARPPSPSSEYSTSESPASSPSMSAPDAPNAAGAGAGTVATNYDPVFGGARPLQEVAAEQKKRRRGFRKAMMGTKTFEGKSQGGLLGWLKRR